MNDDKAVEIAQGWLAKAGETDFDAKSIQREAMGLLLRDLVPEPTATAFLDAPDEAEEPAPRVVVLADDSLYLVEPTRTEEGELALTVTSHPADGIEVAVGETIEYSHGAQFRRRGWIFQLPGRQPNLTFTTEENLSSSAGPGEDERFCRALATAAGWPL